MAKVKQVKSAIRRFEYYQERTDPDYGSCLWARFDLDTENYALTITSDCGDYAYHGWTPTPERESFFRLCRRMSSGYLLGKLSARTVLDYDATLENAVDEIKRFLGDGEINATSDWEEDFRGGFPHGDHEVIVFRYIHDFTDFNGVGLDAEAAEYCIEKDYPAQVKRIVRIFKEWICPVLDWERS